MNRVTFYSGMGIIVFAVITMIFVSASAQSDETKKQDIKQPVIKAKANDLDTVMKIPDVYVDEGPDGIQSIFVPMPQGWVKYDKSGNVYMQNIASITYDDDRGTFKIEIDPYERITVDCGLVVTSFDDGYEVSCEGLDDCVGEEKCILRFVPKEGGGVRFYCECALRLINSRKFMLLSNVNV